VESLVEFLDDGYASEGRTCLSDVTDALGTTGCPPALSISDRLTPTVEPGRGCPLSPAVEAPGL
jgi:hypothetical protein